MFLGVGAQVSYTSKYGGGLALSVDQGRLYGGHDGGMIFALNTTTGVKMWKYDTKMTPACPIRTGGNLFLAEGLVYFGCGSTLWAVNTTVSGGRLAWSAVVTPGATVTGVSYHPQQFNLQNPENPSMSQLSGTVLATANSAGAAAAATIAAYSAYDGAVRLPSSPSPWVTKTAPCTNISYQALPSTPAGDCPACVYVACSGTGSAPLGAVYALALDSSFEQSSWSLYWYSSAAAGVGSNIAVGLRGEVYYGSSKSTSLQSVSVYR